MSAPAETTLTARFVVYRSSEWADLSGARVFLKPMLPHWDEDADDDDPVEQFLFDAALAAIPSQFDFVPKDRDARGGGLFGEEGIEIDVDEPLPIGSVVDLQLRVVGRVEFS